MGISSKLYSAAGRLSRSVSVNSPNYEAITRRNVIFTKLKMDQEIAAKQSISKIVVNVELFDGTQKTLLMNKGISTPLDCAKHISRHLVDNSALAVLSSTGRDVATSSMHEVLTQECNLKFLPFNNKQYAEEINAAFWRSCTLLLSAVVEKSFGTGVSLKSFVEKDVREGFFEVNAKMSDLKEWTASGDELKLLTKSVFHEYILEGAAFERLDVLGDDAMTIFKDNASKQAEIEADLNEGVQTFELVRVGEYVDLAPGLIISNASQIGKFQITHAANKQSTNANFRGIALPKDQPCTSYTWDQLAKRSISN
uniref:TGS domain-containing protein n=1 Tax=Rhabditophanes sp. KR3021 TaxID=114890 RepID=A0AC35U2Y4_9BILA